MTSKKKMVYQIISQISKKLKLKLKKNSKAYVRRNIRIQAIAADEYALFAEYAPVTFNASKSALL